MHKIITKFFFRFYFTLIFRPFFKLLIGLLSKINSESEKKIDIDPSQKGKNQASTYLEEHISFTTKRLNSYPHDHNIFNLLKHLDSNVKDLNKKKILTLGPRNIKELYLIYLAGFKWENIIGMDIISKHNKIKIGDFSKKFPFEDGIFDIVICSHSLSKSNDQYMSAKEIKRVLKPNGIFAIIDNDTVDWHEYICNGYEEQYKTILDLYADSNWQNLIYQRKVNDNTFEAIVKVNNI